MGNLDPNLLSALCCSLSNPFLVAKHGPFHLWLGQGDKVAAMAKIYIKQSIPNLIAQAHFHPLRTFLTTQNIIRPITILVLHAMLLNCPINYFLVVHLEFVCKSRPSLRHTSSAFF
ncbi:hypothetical protein Pfo_019234 [Paulownia fortunei]|nr:hypothetical protein Pfo_019234 [Paulownia fortunei]